VLDTDADLTGLGVDLCGLAAAATGDELSVAALDSDFDDLHQSQNRHLSAALQIASFTIDENQIRLSHLNLHIQRTLKPCPNTILQTVLYHMLTATLCPTLCALFSGLQRNN